MTTRQPDTIFASIILPALMMFLFVSLFGKIIKFDGTSYVNYIVPGILLQCFGQCSSSTAIMMNKDMNSGMVDRLCTLPIQKRSILTGVILTMSWLSLFVGIVADNAEGASSLSAFAIILPYLSSGFVPVETLPKGLRLFAEYQPMTPIIDTMRTAFSGHSVVARNFITALAWCAGLTVILYILSLRLFKKRLRRT